MHIHITNGSKCITFHGRDRHKESTLSLSARHKAQQLLSITRFAEKHENITGGEDTNITVEGIERERNPAGMPREIKVWEILLATKPDLPTPEKNSAGGIEEGLGEGKGLGEIKVLEEVIKVVLLGFEEIEEGILVNLGIEIGRRRVERPHLWYETWSWIQGLRDNTLQLLGSFLNLAFGTMQIPVVKRTSQENKELKMMKRNGAFRESVN
ncbi:hypothetical protein GH714_027210 [Hevea brasiliensis]|uniref:Uncharacterized protein n=1 Tax=Hevea brasiliensis TaxID=3981 RepID=A0A6A6KUQ1_HEVBR|nr:hypothetical protein GH714_027210 [Hevea brasiliensis]